MISLRGREERGNGSVKATVTTQLKRERDHTRVDLATDLEVSGRAAQFGRGILGDVVSSVLGEFATGLERMVAGTIEPAPRAAASAEPAPTTGAALDVRRVVLVPLMRRATVPAACLLAGGVGGWLLARSGARARRRLPRIVIQT